MKLFIIFIVILYAFALSDNIDNIVYVQQHYSKRKASEYCFGKNEMELKKIYKNISREYYINDVIYNETETEIEQSIVYLSDEYKLCDWRKWRIRAEARLNDDIMLKGDFYYGTFYTRKYDSIFVDDISSFDYYSLSYGMSFGKACENVCKDVCEPESSVEKIKKYNDIILPLLKSSVGKIFMIDISIEVKCPHDDYTEDGPFDLTGSTTNIKINYPIVIVGECVE